MNIRCIYQVVKENSDEMLAFQEMVTIRAQEYSRPLLLELTSLSTMDYLKL